MALYAAYGTNLDPAMMAVLAPSSPARETGWLMGWRLTFAGSGLGWQGALATVVEDPASSVFVTLYDVTPRDEFVLDRWEGTDLDTFRKIRVRVQTLTGDRLSWLYVVDAYEGGLPSARYLETIATAAEVAGAPGEYVADLRRRPCSGDGPIGP